jgi:hypothetical protein
MAFFLKKTVRMTKPSNAPANELKINNGINPKRVAFWPR